MRDDIDSAQEEIVKLLQSGVPRFEVCRRFQCKYDTLAVRLKRWGYAHLKNQAKRGIPQPNRRVSADKYLNTTKYISAHKLKLKLIEEGYKKHQCEICLNSEWMGLPIPLELHHIDGDHTNNRLENLQVLCPTCHAQQLGNSGAAAKRPRVPQLEEGHGLGP
jgi:5-methylcytosine-specific restriction endonuclease McrA